MSREALLSAVWPGVVVGDDSLTQVVIKLRKALGDAPEKPAYIQTIPKGGTGWSRVVRPDAESVHAERKPLAPWMAGAGIAALLLAAAGAWWIKGEGITGIPPGQVTPMAMR